MNNKLNKNKFLNFNRSQHHSFHLVDPSPWPLITGISALTMTNGGVSYMHGYIGGGTLLISGIFGVLLCMLVWWRDVIREGTFEGQHTQIVQKGLKMGMILFIVSEIMFFFGFFWAFFHSSFGPTHEIGGVFPPAGLEILNPWEIPLLNTLILLTSGATCTWAHDALIAGDRFGGLVGLISTVFLGIWFTLLQVYEYLHAPFTMSDGIYGSTFFMATGFHGFHVLIGTTFLIVCLIRHYYHHFTREHHFGFEAAVFYWHFVDVVWLFLFVSIYWWGS